MGPRREFRAAARPELLPRPAPRALPPPLLAPARRPRATPRGRVRGRLGRGVPSLPPLLGSPARAWRRGFPEEELRGAGRGSPELLAAPLPPLSPPSLPPFLSLPVCFPPARRTGFREPRPGRVAPPAVLTPVDRGAWQGRNPALLLGLWATWKQLEKLLILFHTLGHKIKHKQQQQQQRETSPHPQILGRGGDGFEVQTGSSTCFNGISLCGSPGPLQPLPFLRLQKRQEAGIS